MKNCLNCGNELHGLQEMFCSKRCKNSSRWKRMTEEEKVIAREKNRKRYKEKQEERLKQKAEYYQLNREMIIKKNTAYKKEHPETDKRYTRGINGRYRDYKRGAKSRKLEFSLTVDDFAKYWNNNCYYCGDEIIGVGLDRIDNDLGYTTKNIVPCCGTCNIMRNRLRQKDFINQCNKIVNNLYGQAKTIS